MTRLVVRLGVVASFAVACGEPPDHVDWTVVTVVPEGGSFTPSSVCLPAGATASARATLFIDGEERSCDVEPTVVDPTVMSATSAARGAIVFTALAVGRTNIVLACPKNELSIEGITTAAEGSQ